MMVEIFCGILAGAQYSRNIRTWKVTDKVANLVRVATSRFLQQETDGGLKSGDVSFE